jgi:hypothetical protein
MKSWIKRLSAATGGLAATATAATAIGHWQWHRATHAARHRLLAPTQAPGSAYSADALRDLPAPVSRYFHYALQDGQVPIKCAVCRQIGDVRRGGLDTPWSRFTATETFTAAPPGYLWDADIRLGAGLSVRVRDGFMSGRGLMQASLAALFPVVRESGRPELSAAALQRFLAEAVWLPTALLPSPYLAWREKDADQAEAVLTVAGVSATMTFQFGSNGEIVRAYTSGRYRAEAGHFVLTPWEGHMRNYMRVSGMLVPMDTEAAWLLPAGRLSYWRGRIVEIEYQFASPLPQSGGLVRRNKLLGRGRLE